MFQYINRKYGMWRSSSPTGTHWESQIQEKMRSWPPTIGQSFKKSHHTLGYCSHNNHMNNRKATAWLDQTSADTQLFNSCAHFVRLARLYRTKDYKIGCPLEHQRTCASLEKLLMKNRLTYRKSISSIHLMTHPHTPWNSNDSCRWNLKTPSIVKKNQ